MENMFQVMSGMVEQMGQFVQESSISEEVEAELRPSSRGSSHTPLLPSKKARHPREEPLSSPRGLTPGLPPSSGAILSNRSTVVQLRRGQAAPRGIKQAPAPPKRTSSFRDSTYTDTVDGLSDGRNDGNGIEQIFEGINRDLVSLANSGNFADSEGDQGDGEAEEEDSMGGDERFASAAALSSFKRAPAMGGRVLDQRSREEKRSRSRGAEKKPKASSDRRVGALDERNLKKAAHRYGTLPKGARIGAYLESLRVSGMTPEPPSDESGQDTLESTKSGHTDPGGRSIASEPPPTVMARSNSSHGGFPGAGHRPRPGPLSSQLPRRLQGNSNPPAPSSPRSAPKSSALAELDFPPPPSDSLPPVTPPLQPRPRDPSSDSCDSLSDRGSLHLGCVSPVASPGPAAAHQAQLVQEMLAVTPPLPPASPLPPAAEDSATPAAQLVTELFESLKAKSSPEASPPSPEVPMFKPTLKKVVTAPPPPAANNTSPPPVNFKSQLKKTNSSLYAQPGAAEEAESP